MIIITDLKIVNIPGKDYCEMYELNTHDVIYSNNYISQCLNKVTIKGTRFKCLTMPIYSEKWLSEVTQFTKEEEVKYDETIAWMPNVDKTIGIPLTFIEKIQKENINNLKRLNILENELTRIKKMSLFERIFKFIINI